jgi:hypothetical protein
MRYRIALVPLLGLSLFTPVALAHASPPDETWQPGIYDDADFDDVVLLITSLTGATPEAPVALARRTPAAGALVAIVVPGELPARLVLPDASRSPPSV